jgi:tetratricopeptide (TPR) repeat protein
MMDRSHLLRVAALAAAVAVSGCSSASKDGAPAATSHARARSTKPTDSFENAHKDPPIAAETRYAAGQLAEARNNLPAAIEQYRAAVKRDPKYARALYRLGVVLAQSRKYGEAVEVWQRYIKATGESAAAYSNLGFCYELARRPEDAEDAYRKGVGRDPSNVPCRVNYGLMLVRKGRVGEGQVQLSAVLQPAEVHYNIGSVYEATGRKEQAKAEYRAALKADPQFVDAVTRLNELECGPAPAGTPTPTAPRPLAPAAAAPIQAPASPTAAAAPAPVEPAAANPSLPPDGELSQTEIEED